MSFIRRSATSFGVFVSLLLGCSTANKEVLPPDTDLYPPEAAQWPINQTLTADKDFISIDLFLSRVAAEDQRPSTRWWADYRRAQLWTKKDAQVACENFSRLASEPKFPLRRLAYLRAHEVCPANNQILARLEPFDLNTFEPWLSSFALDIALKKSLMAKDKKVLLDLNLKKSKLNLRREDKVKHTQEALKYAESLGLKKEREELLKRLYKLSPSLNPSPSRSQYLSVAHDFRYFRKFNQARKYYWKVIKDRRASFSDKVAAYRGIRTSYRVQQDRDAALKTTADLAAFVKKNFKKSRKRPADVALYLETQLMLARNYWTLEKRRNAETILDEITKTLGPNGPLTEVYWMRGRMAEEQQKFAEAVEWYDKALAQNGSTKSFRERLEWYRAWNLRKLKEYKTAAEAFAKLSKETESSFDKARYRFWLARTYREMGEKDDAEDEFEDLIEDDPLSFYGLVAHHELGLPLPVKNLSGKSSDDSSMRPPLSLRAQLDEPFIEWLIAVREETIAREYLEDVAARVRESKNSDLKTWASLFHLYARANQYLSMFTQLNKLDSAMKKSLIDEHPDLIFPRPYFETVSHASVRFGISTEFIYSIMRQESSFNPQARSHMDAFGLMQLLPEVAKRSAEANSIHYNNPEDLYEPHINIPLGSAHLRELWDRYNGEVILAAASYNASEQAILNWLNTRFRGDTMEFIEDIPYDETRDYVKLVLRNLITYQMLNSPTGPVPFPDWALRISHNN